MRSTAKVRTLRSPARRAVVAIAGVLLAVSVLVAGIAQVIAASGDKVMTTSRPPVRATSSAAVAPTPTTLPALERVERTDVVRRAPVGRPADYRGSILRAPAAALAAYQRAAVVITSAASCRLEWTTLAAIARVESDHGRGLAHDHRVTAQGAVRPALVGAPLDGRHGRGRLSDTDGGRLDADPRWDAPVGPLGLLPSIWASVAVDADGDGRRDPQDLDDASLAAAVVLCSAMQQGATLRAALRGYHRAPGFVRTVLALGVRYARQAAAHLPPADGPPVTPLPDLPLVCPCEPARVSSLTRPKDWVAVPGPPTPTPTPSPSPSPGATPPPTPSASPTDASSSPTEPTTPSDPTTTRSTERQEARHGRHR